MFVFRLRMIDGEGDGDTAAQQASKQMQDKGYAEKYRDRNEPVHLIGVAFGRDRSPAEVKVASA